MLASPRPTTALRSTRHALAVAAFAVAVAVLSGCTADADTDPAGQPPASESPAASDDPSTAPDPTDTSTPAAPSVSEQLAEAISGGNTTPIEDFLTDPTRVVIAASEADMEYSKVDAVIALDYLRPGEGTWDFALDTAVVDSYAANPYYGEFFTDDATVGRSDAGLVVSFVPSGELISTIFMAAHESLLTDY
jgi:hypothetical protein